jgi:hypothetical protein
MLRPSVLISSINLPSALSATISLSPAIFLKILVSCVVVSPFDTGVLLDISFFLSYQYELLLKWMGSIPSQHQNKYQHLLESFHIPIRKDYTL